MNGAQKTFNTLLVYFHIYPNDIGFVVCELHWFACACISTIANQNLPKKYLTKKFS